MGLEELASVGATLLDELTSIRGFFFVQLAEFKNIFNNCTDLLCIKQTTIDWLGTNLDVI